MLTARGGTSGPGDRNSYGGGGGGGLISVMTPSSAAADALVARSSVAGGGVDDCPGNEATAGVSAVVPAVCFDGDGDGQEACPDGSGDCNEGRQEVNGIDACETCNGSDDNCDGEVDNQAPGCEAICATQGHVCIPPVDDMAMAECGLPGTSSGSGAGSPPAIQFGGGLCAMQARGGPTRHGHNPVPGVFWLAALGLAIGRLRARR